MKYFTIISLGCPKNLVDSEYFLSIFNEAGYHKTDEPDKADIILVNTCGFIQDAKEESIDTILELSVWKMKGKCKKLIVTGCLVKRYMDELKNAIPEVDEWIALKDFAHLEMILNMPSSERKRSLLTPHYYAYLRISDGCNNKCSYCAIPSIRGDLKSEPVEDLLTQAKRLADEGVKEIIINAQDTTQYGTDLYGKQSLMNLVKQIHAIPSIEWIRLLYLHPAHITKEMIDEIAGLPKVCRYFDIPLQHINNDILKSMNRRITKEAITEIINYIRFVLPDAVIRTTFITGYPGEKIKEFNELIDYVKTMKFGRLGAFAYSPEEGTPAALFNNKVTLKTAQTRKDKIMAMQQEISSDFLMTYIGQTIEVLIERKSADKGFLFEGRSRFDAPEIDGIVYITKGKAKIGDIVKARVIESWEYDLIAEII